MQVLVNWPALIYYLMQSDNSLSGAGANPAKYVIEETIFSVELFQEYAKVFLFALVIAALISQLIKGG